MSISKSNSKKIVFLSVLISLLAACGAEKGTQEMILELDNKEDFFAQGFPTDFKRDENNKIDVSAFPDKQSLLPPLYKKVIDRDIEGYAPNIPLYIQFDTGVSNRLVELYDEPLAYANSASSIQLVDVDPASPERGRRFPLRVKFTEAVSSYRPGGHLLQAVPAGELLKENTTYALVVFNSVMPSIADTLSINPILTQLLLGEDPRSIDSSISALSSKKAMTTYAPLREQLIIDNLEVNTVIGAIVWTTGEPSLKLRQVAKYAASLPPSQPETSVVFEEEADGYCVLQSSWRVPVYQKGSVPYLVMGTDSGLLSVNGEGEPSLQYYRTASFRLALPKTAMPSAGFPMVFFDHGAYGDSKQMVTRGVTLEDGITPHRSPAHIATLRGWSMASMSNDSMRNPFTFINMTAMRDSFIQMVAEQIVFRRLINELEIDASLCPGTESDTGTVFFDVSNQVVMGQSQGSMIAMAQGATDPEGYQGIIAGGSGAFNLGSVMNIAIGGDPFIISGNFFEPLFFSVFLNHMLHDQFHPLWLLSQMAVAPADYSIHVSRWLRDPNVEIPAPDILIVEGYFDEWLRPWNKTQILIAAGVDLVGPDLTEIPFEDQILPHLRTAGYEQHMTDVTNNRGDRTVGVVHYPEDGIMTGHHAMFQREAPQHQYGCFLESLYRNGEATIVVEGLNYDSPCL